MPDNRELRVNAQPTLIAEMTFEQAERKRASDRVHQRYSRARKQTRIAELERQNATLSSQLIEMEKKLQELRKSHETLQATVDSARAVVRTSRNSSSSFIATHSPQDPEVEVSINNPRPTASPSPNPHALSSPSMPSPRTGCLPVNLDSSSSYLLDLPLDFSADPVSNLRDDLLIGRSISSSGLPEENYFEFLPWLVSDQLVQGCVATRAAGCEEVRTNLEIEYQPEYALPPYISEWSLAGQLFPIHLPPITPTDHVLIEVSEFGRRWSRQKGEQYGELWLPNFPRISSLLEPTSRDAQLNPISAAIGKHTTWATSVHSLPSRVAYHYMIAQMIRWMVCRTEQSYNQLPTFLRPTQLQRIIPHPAWVDVFPWIEGRDLIIKHMDYGKFDSFHEATASFSVNWPYTDADMFLKDSTHGYLFLNPVFEAHIREAKNWTFDLAVVQRFPFLRSCPTTPTK